MRYPSYLRLDPMAFRTQSTYNLVPQSKHSLPGFLRVSFIISQIPKVSISNNQCYMKLNIYLKIAHKIIHLDLSNYPVSTDGREKPPAFLYP